MTTTSAPACGPAGAGLTWPPWPWPGCGPASCAPTLSALGIAIGVAAIVAVLGLAASSSAALLAEIGRLGSNLLTVTNGQTLSGAIAELPESRARHDRPAARRHQRPGHRHCRRRQRL